VDGLGVPAALVEFCCPPGKIVIFIVRSGETEPAVVEVPMPHRLLSRHLRNYMNEVLDYPSSGDIGQRWQDLAEPLLKDVLPYLKGAELVYLVPHHLLHYVPLHALSAGGSPLIERFPIVYAPSTATLDRVLHRRLASGRRMAHHALVVGYAPDEAERSLFEGEAAEVARLLGTTAHLGKEATSELLHRVASGYELLHLSCHGVYVSEDALASYLQLADGDWTARDIMGLRLELDLVTLSACASGYKDQRPGDEPVGLPSALLYAGVSSALVTGWNVDAGAAMALMRSFYERLRPEAGREAVSKATALREAILALRREWAHPYYWAPFMMVGDWR
jgi:CHAT domain-containing protein